MTLADINLEVGSILRVSLIAESEMAKAAHVPSPPEWDTCGRPNDRVVSRVLSERMLRKDPYCLLERPDVVWSAEVPPLMPVVVDSPLEAVRMRQLFVISFQNLRDLSALQPVIPFANLPVTNHFQGCLASVREPVPGGLGRVDEGSDIWR